MRLLVAEDDAGLRSVLERGLRRGGHVDDAVADGLAEVPPAQVTRPATAAINPNGGSP